eukprot:TRINITY_DN1849_c0_g1_i1.p2 TRINITY_DN1849_c0_g1~~TRINITY_DN1849_c0_g1_i1.p2  ORF type:complete len:557 (-),score=96.56 TRINITY_DN1849_c0_g1_i1:5801-7249(-)
MDLVPARDENADTLLNDLTTSANPATPDFPQLVSTFLTPSAPAALPEWALPTLSRPFRSDSRYEFSLNAADFDTDSVDAHASPSHSRAFDDDDASTDVRGTATSEDTSLPFDNPPQTTTHVSAHLSSPRASTKNESVLRVTPSVNASLKAVSTSNGASCSSPSVAMPTTSSGNAVKRATTAMAASKATKSIKKRSAPTNKSSRVSVPSASAAASGATSTGPSAPGLSHTKMCRDRLNNMFERLKKTLPPAPSGVEVKHKAQVLDYAIYVLKSMVERTSQLEIELAVSSNKATMEWIAKLVDRVNSLPEAADEVMRLFIRRRSWKHAELWIASKRACAPNAPPEQSVILRFCHAVCNERGAAQRSVLEKFSKESETYAFRAREGVPGRVWSSMRPEWVTGLGDGKNFQRAALARKYGLKVCLAVPVTITGKIEAVMCFYDTKHRAYDTQCLELAMNLAWALGNAVGGKRAKSNFGATSGISSS